jgi:altronate hydrolase
MIKTGKLLVIQHGDDVAVALRDIGIGESFPMEDGPLAAQHDVPAGHKIALRSIPAGQSVHKYGYPIGTATAAIPRGGHVHTHNLATALEEDAAYEYAPVPHEPVCMEPREFQGFVREDGSVGVRNEIWVIPTVGCVNRTAELAAERARLRLSGVVDGVYAFPHPYGCSQMGDDQLNTQRILAGLARHPNAAGVLVLGLGCENNGIDEMRKAIGGMPGRRIRYLAAQDQPDEIEAAVRAITELAGYASGFHRVACPVSRLVIGLKCGGSDGFSGITANPLVGAVSDLIVAQGGSALLTEVPEMFGAETILMNRAVTRDVFMRTADMVNGFKQYYASHGQPIYENPSPGNKAGGITTLEDKSLGCTQKAGTAPVVDVLEYGQAVRTPGLNLLAGPGNDIVACTALAAAGAQVILFTTGRGTPLGAPVPTLKISSNTALYEHKRNWIDFNAGRLLDGEDGPALAGELFEAILATASGRQTRSELNGYREIAIFKNGVTL